MLRSTQIPSHHAKDAVTSVAYEFQIISVRFEQSFNLGKNEMVQLFNDAFDTLQEYKFRAIVGAARQLSRYQVYVRKHRASCNGSY